MQQSDWQLKSTPALFIYAIDALKARRDGSWEDFHTKKKNIDNGNSQKCLFRLYMQCAIYKNSKLAWAGKTQND